MQPDDSHHGPSTVQTLSLNKFNFEDSSSYGFHLTRTKWDPYPWVSKVDDGSPAETAGVRGGQCLLEVNGEDLLGKCVSEVADRVRTNSPQVSLVVWQNGTNASCSPETLCCGPMTQNLQKLSTCLSSILANLECPICLDTIPPPVHQCDNGHVICLNCRSKTERCPVCRMRIGTTRSLVAEQVYNIITDTFDLKNDSEQVRKTRLKSIFKTKSKNLPDIRITPTPSHATKFLTWVVGKSASVDNLNDPSAKVKLKTKSRSTNEIFDEGVVRQTQIRPEDTDHNNLAVNNATGLHQMEPVSSYGSCDSLHPKRFLQETARNRTHVYHCPYHLNCTDTLKACDIMKHFKENHEGPLKIQYFKSNLSIPIQQLYHEGDSCHLISLEEHYFVVRIFVISEDDEDTGYSSLLIGMWMVDGEEMSKGYELKVDIKGTSGKTLLSLAGLTHSLSTVSLKEFLCNRRGVFINSQALQTVGHTNRYLAVHVDVLNVRNQ